MSKNELLLASTSPRRRQMLAWMVADFEMMSFDIDESIIAGEKAEAYVFRMAKSKARHALQGNEHYKLILSSDTIVVQDGKILGKPENEAQARAMLQRLRGKIHKVLTAISVVNPESGLMITDCCIANVPMRNYSDEEIEHYIQSGDPFDKAGSYAIQNESFHPVEHFSGCFACVMGLPLCHVIRQMKKQGISIIDDARPVCAEQLDYACPISSSVLSFTDQITCCD
ncbi:MAG: septum formation protein Maf [Anaerolineaceae bacterium]|nr:septum formation protein Maf [Anaerolineaceae bacterium]